ncbi:MAG: hypothetical protein GX152_06820 [Methanosarcina sp.]|nr:hypothetical protein [Methanosarcina sp.]
MIKKIKISAIFMTVLLVSIAFVPTVMAQAESQNKEYADAIDIPNNIPISEEEIKKASENMDVLKETDKEKILSIKKKDGSIGYAILRKDEKNPNRVNLAFVDQKDLVAKNLISAASLNDREAVVVALSRVNILFASYVETYGSSTTGGLHFHFGERDAEWIIAVGASAYGAVGAGAAALLSLGSAATAAVGAAICIALATFYWVAQNNDGSLDVSAPYANIATILVLHKIFLKVGSSWYWVSI